MENNEKLVILNYLSNEGHSVMTEEIIDLVNELKEELETLDSNSDRYSEILEELEEYDDYIGPDDLDEERYSHYDLNVYSIPKLGESYAVGTTDEADSALEEFIRSYVEDGYRNINEFISNNVKYISNYIDNDKLRDDLYDDQYNFVSEDAESYLDASDRDLSPEQEERIEILEIRIAKYEDLKSKRSDPNKIQDIDSAINKLNEKIDEIKESPEGDFNEESIGSIASSMVDEMMSDLDSLVNDYGINLEPYFELDNYISDTANHESYGSLSSYDGDYYETKIDGEFYIVVRTE
jgi:hypothetical protein